MNQYNIITMHDVTNEYSVYSMYNATNEFPFTPKLINYRTHLEKYV